MSAEVYAAVPAAVPAAVCAAVCAVAHAIVGSGTFDSADIYFVDFATVAVQPLEMSAVAHYMFAAGDTAAADTVLSTADSAVANPSKVPVDMYSEAAEKYAAERSVDIPAATAAACFGR